MPCEYRQQNLCQIATKIAECPVEIQDIHCQHCEAQENPRSINHVTASVAIFELTKTNKSKALELIKKHRHLLVRQDQDTYPCTHRGSVLGKMDCRCQGKKEVYACEIHGKCALRKLVPGRTQIIIDDQIIVEDIKFCNACEDIRSE